MSQKLIFIVEPSENDFRNPLKIGNIFFNRFGVNEDEAFELLGIYYLQKSSFAMGYPKHKDYKYVNLEQERVQKELYDRKIVETAIKEVSKIATSHELHIIYAGGFYWAHFKGWASEVGFL